MKRLSLPIQKPLLYSLTIHLICFSVILLTPQSAFKKEPKTNVYWVRLPKGASKEVDFKIKESKGLPKTTIREQKFLAKKEKEQGQDKVKEKQLAAPFPKKEAKKPKLRAIQEEPRPKGMKLAGKEKKTVKKPKQAEWQKALAALEKRPKYAEPEAAQVQEKGEGFQYGTGTEPLKIPPTDPEYLAYQAKVRYKIIQQWVLPLAYVEAPQAPRAMIAVQIDKHGIITNKNWEYRSGNPAFDSSCMRAIQRASPLPMPPERLAWEAYNEGFLVEFDPSLKVN